MGTLEQIRQEILALLKLHNMKLYADNDAGAAQITITECVPDGLIASCNLYNWWEQPQLEG